MPGKLLLPDFLCRGRLERLQRVLNQLAPRIFFFVGREGCVTGDVDNAASKDDPVGAHHFGYGHSRGDLDHGDARLFQLRRDRSAAASARASGRS